MGIFTDSYGLRGWVPPVAFLVPLALLVCWGVHCDGVQRAERADDCTAQCVTAKARPTPELCRWACVYGEARQPTSSGDTTVVVPMYMGGQ